ncbi:hypothetical protein [Capybara microvirus Cap1_SP_104]|nr:hypothetical protein [Capybara microvirus Cap1_SP_104]
MSVLDPIRSRISEEMLYDGMHEQLDLRILLSADGKPILTHYVPSLELSSMYDLESMLKVGITPSGSLHCDGNSRLDSFESNITDFQTLADSFTDKPE